MPAEHVTPARRPLPVSPRYGISIVLQLYQYYQLGMHFEKLEESEVAKSQSLLPDRHCRSLSAPPTSPCLSQSTRCHCDTVNHVQTRVGSHD